MATKPTLFVGLDGPLLVPSANPDPFLGAEIVPYAKAFLTWAAKHYNVQLLTDRSPRDAFYCVNKLGLQTDQFPVRTFVDSKIPIVTGHPQFFWVDEELIPSEMSWLAEHGHGHRIVQVDSLKGITPEHKSVLEARTRGIN